MDHIIIIKNQTYDSVIGFINNPTPINASMAERMREMLADNSR